MRGKFNEIPLGELTTPRDGLICMCNRFWLIGPNGGVISYDDQRRGRSRPDRFPQCNSNEAIVKMWLAKAPGGAVSYKLIPVAYWLPNLE